MLLMSLTAVQQNIHPVAMYSTIGTKEEFLMVTEQVSSGLSQPLEKISIGQTSYQFIRQALANWLPSIDGWACYLSELSIYTGRGANPKDAFEDLKIQIHTDFQRLVGKRPFEMDGDEQKKWSKIANLIDLLHYKTTTPLVVREIGQVSHGKISRPYKIKWMSGKTYRIRPEKVSGELMSCAPGQWIEATVKKDPVTLKVLEIEFINKIRLRVSTESEIRNFWESIPRAELESGQWT